MYAKFRKVKERYARESILAVIGVATAAVLLAEVWAAFGDLISSVKVAAFATFLIVGDMALSVQAALSRARAVQISREQDSLMATLLQAADSTQRDSTADLLEYAGGSITPLIRRLRDRDVPMRILIKHPETCGEYQQRRTQTHLESLFGSVLAGFRGSVEVRCYRAPYTLRGRRIGSRFLELGWLTPDFDRSTAFGRVNPSIHLDPTVEGSEYLLAFFEKTFEDLWNHPDTIDARCVLRDGRSPCVDA